MRMIHQCEGCEYPLGQAENLNAYERGELIVEWFVCEYHTSSGLPFVDEFGDYDY